MNYITLNKENLASEHICCAISKNDDCQVASKKAWLYDRFDDGLVFLRGDVRGKCFIEYIPAEKAWSPVIADGWMYIDCLWVSGQFKGQGISNELLDMCIKDSREKGKHGLCALSSKKKMGFLADPAYLRYKGFEVVDTAEPSYELYCLPFDDAAEKPRFTERVKTPHIDDSGYVLYYCDQCPFTAKYVPIAVELAASMGVEIKTVHIDTLEAAKNAPAPVTLYGLFKDGKLVTHEILSEKKLTALLEKA